MNRADRLRKAHEKLRVATERYHTAIATLIPLGFRVVWYHGGHQRSGIVLDVAWTRVAVKTKNSERCWIHAERIRSIEYEAS
jgi:hypothetical protein